jgi:hypothetical protein
VLAQKVESWWPVGLVGWRWREIEGQEDVVDGRFAVVDIGSRGDSGARLKGFGGRLGLWSRDVDFVAVSALELA